MKSVFLFFEWFLVQDIGSICHIPVSRNFVAMDEIDGICAMDSVDISLSKATPFVAKDFVLCVFGGAF